MKRTEKIVVWSWIGLAICIIIASATANCHGQVYNSWASAQVRHSVEIDSFKLKVDTVRDYLPMSTYIVNHFYYPGFVVDIIKSDEVDFKVFALTANGSYAWRLMLKPEDEYAILEKLISQTK